MEIGIEGAAVVVSLVLAVAIVGGALAVDQTDVDPREDEVVGSMTIEDLLYGAGFVGLTIGGLVSLAVGAKAGLAAGRIALNRPVPAGEAHRERGVIEVEGTAEPVRGTMGAHVTGRDCVACRWKKERKRVSGEGSGNPTWDTVDEGEGAIPFRVTDESGSIAVDPTGASLSLATHVERRSPGATYKTRQHEGRLEPGEVVHVYGHRREAGEGESGPGDADVYVGSGDGTFKISDTTQARTILRSGVRTVAFAAFGVFLVWLAVVITPGLP